MSDVKVSWLFSLMEKAECLFFGHSVVTIEKLSDQARHIGCVRCRREYAINDVQRIVIPWNEQTRQFYKDMDQLIRRFQP